MCCLHNFFFNALLIRAPDPCPRALSRSLSRSFSWSGIRAISTAAKTKEPATRDLKDT
jgi:hypothetical protein